MMNENFLTGPVEVKREVRAAFAAAPFSHREPEFITMMSRTRASLKNLANASNVALLVGSGTLANDAVAAQLRDVGGRGLILSNGEFGERLIDHARRWGLVYTTKRLAWGAAFDWNQLGRQVERFRPAWIWAVLTETSTGVANPLSELLNLARRVDADLCVDAISAVGLMRVDLQHVRFATAVSGKALSAFPGLAAVFHDGRLCHSSRIPRYLDLVGYERDDSVPFTHSSNLVAALDCALALTDWTKKFERVERESRRLRFDLKIHGLPALAMDLHAAPGIFTVPLPVEVSAAVVGAALSADGIHTAYQSRYLRQRNWLQICLMGEFSEAVLHELPGALARRVTCARNARRDESVAVLGS